MLIKTKRGARRIRNQRVIDRRFVVTDYNRCSYITAGKLYRLFDVDGWLSKHIESDTNRSCAIYQLGKCAHLKDIGTWYHPIR